MSRFDEAIYHVLETEGGRFTNIEGDHGGPTKWGITLGFYRSHVDSSATVENIKDLSRSEAKEIYRKHFWQPSTFTTGKNYGHLPVGVDSFVFSLAVNMGWKQAHFLLQDALRFLGQDITRDGWLGPETTEAAHNVDVERLIKRLATKAGAFYTNLVLRDRSQRKFLEGWLFRAFSDTVRSVKDLA